MGFCRRCGDIVAGIRCKCGGTAVAPVVSWNNNEQGGDALDKWSKTYIAREPPMSPVRREQDEQNPASNITTKPHPSRNIIPRSTLPMSSSNLILDDKVSEYITRTTSQSSSSASSSKPFLSVNPNADILPSIVPHDTTLSKVYGSLLQPKESLSTHSCAICSVSFPPDATIYPDPSQDDFSSDRFLCRQCYISNGGSKGACALCSKPVLTLKSEGGFIHAAGKYWHKRCFNCNGCSLNVSDSPMVDLFGRPSCLECFETCLKRDNSTPKKPNIIKPETRSNLGGMKVNASDSKIRESSPGIEELEQRLGIVKNRQGSPALEELTQRLSMIGKEIGTRQSPSPSPARPIRNSLPSRMETAQSPSLNHLSNCQNSLKTEYLERSLTTSPSTPVSVNRVNSHATGSPIPTEEAIEEMKNRFLKNAVRSASPPNNAEPTLGHIAPLRPSRSVTSLRSSTNHKHSTFTPSPSRSLSCRSSDPSISDLVSDMYEIGTMSSCSDLNREFLDGAITDHHVATLPQEYLSKIPPDAGRYIVDNGYPSVRHSIPVPLSSSDQLTRASCARCGGTLAFGQNGGQYITTASGPGTINKDAYHRDCFRCVECSHVFDDNGEGRAVFTRTFNGQPCHIECIPKEKNTLRKSISAGTLRKCMAAPSQPSVSNYQSSSHLLSKSPPTYTVTSSRYERSILATSSVSASSSRFGSRTACPGCNRAVSPMEFGVVPGPHGTRWHATCLVCGGKKETPKGPAWILNRGRECSKRTEPGCGKKLDSAAKTDHEGRVWCRECLLLLGVGGSPQSSPTRAPINSSYTGSGMIPQYTGGTTIARQFTGVGIVEPNLLKQLTGGGLSPTRSISPTKQLGLANGAGPRRPRPKSAIGMRWSKSVDEGRGMFLARQLTGASSVHR